MVQILIPFKMERKRANVTSNRQVHEVVKQENQSATLPHLSNHRETPEPPFVPTAVQSNVDNSRSNKGVKSNYQAMPFPPSYQQQNYASTPGSGPPPSARVIDGGHAQVNDHNMTGSSIESNEVNTAAASKGIKLLASPSGNTGGNTISHRILTTHGASSEVFLKHLQQTWDLHQTMQSETESMKNDIETYKSKLESAQAEAGAARQECQIARSQLLHLKKSNEAITNEISSMRNALNNVRGRAQQVQERSRAEREKFQQQIETQHQTIINLTGRLEESQEQSKREAGFLQSKHREIDQLKMDFASMKQAKENAINKMNNMSINEGEMEEHLKRLVKELKECDGQCNNFRSK